MYTPGEGFQALLRYVIDERIYSIETIINTTLIDEIVDLQDLERIDDTFRQELTIRDLTNSDFQVLFKKIGDAYFSKGAFGAALNAYLLAIDHNSENYWVNYRAGNILLGGAKSNDALRQIDEIMQVAYNNAPNGEARANSLLVLAQVKAQQNNYEKVCEYALAANQILPSSKADQLIDDYDCK